jgi:hypothetical protein
MRAGTVSVLVVAIDSTGRRHPTIVEKLSASRGACNKAPDGLALTHSLICELGTTVDIIVKLDKHGTLRLFKNEFVRGHGQVIVIPIGSSVDDDGSEPYPRHLVLPSGFCRGQETWLEFKKVNSDKIGFRVAASRDCSLDLRISDYGLYVVTAYREGRPVGVARYEHARNVAQLPVRLSFTLIN